MKQKIAVVGTGAIGSSVGADLTIAGHDVVLVDQWPEHVDAMKRTGLRIKTREDEYHTPVRAYHLCELSTLNTQFDIIFIAVKSNDTEWIAQLVLPYLKPTGVVVGIQNGMNDETIYKVVGYPRTIGCAVELAAEVFTPGEVYRKTARAKTWFGIGELHGRESARIHLVREILSAAGTVAVVPNIWNAKWTKLCTSTMVLGTFGMLGMQSSEAIDNQEVFELCLRAGRETVIVGEQLGYRIEPIFGLKGEEFRGTTDQLLEKIVRTLIGHIGKGSRNAVFQDHIKGRKSETDFLNGLIWRHGERLDVTTPANRAVTLVTHRIERREIQPDISNLALARQLMVG